MRKTDVSSSGSFEQKLQNNFGASDYDMMEDFIWTTSYYHPNNTFTMNEYLDEHLPDEYECFFQDDSYAEIHHKVSGKIYGLHASGNGDSFNHRIRFEFMR